MEKSSNLARLLLHRGEDHSGLEADLRHLVTRMAVHGFHHKICLRLTKSFHEPGPDCVCELCDMPCARYHALECKNRGRSLIKFYTEDWGNLMTNWIPKQWTESHLCVVIIMHWCAHFIFYYLFSYLVGIMFTDGMWIMLACEGKQTHV